MKISEVCIRRPVFASMMIAALVVFGLAAYRSIGVDLFPDVDIPIVTITVPYPGADPETVEREVTDKVEEAVNTISGIKTLRSQSVEGLSLVFVEFELEVSIDVASQDVRDKVAAIRGDLPIDIEPPIVEKFDIDSSPILAIVVSGPVSVRELSEYADEVVKQSIEGIRGVGSVRLVGDREREVRIWLRADRLRAHQVTAQDVIDALRVENLDPPGGRIETDRREITVKTQGKIERVEDFADVIVVNHPGAPIRIRDLAWVEDGMEDFRSLAQLNGQRAVSLEVRRQSGTNMVAVADAVKKEVESLRASVPPGHQLIVAQDLSIYVGDSIGEAQGELLRGGILAVAVILFFLRSVRGSFVAALTIPTTIIATVAFVRAMGFTINMMTTLALTISVGMIIDDTIVVLENSYRHMEEGLSRFQAALAGISEIGFAVVATSLAICAVFIPVAYMEGMVGRFFFEFGLTVSFAVAISTFIALTLAPMLCSRVLKVTKSHGRVFNLIERMLEATERAYSAMLGWALGHRAGVVVGAVVVFVGSLGLSSFLGQEFIPDADEDQFNIQVETPVGTSIHGTGAVMREIEARVRPLPGVTEVYTTVGGGQQERVNVATMLTRLAPKAARRQGQFEIMQMARERLADLSHLKISVEAVPRVGGGGFRSAPVQYNLRGRNLDQLAALSEEFQRRMAETPGMVDVNTTYDAGKPEVRVVRDASKSRDLGITTRDVAMAVRALVGGEDATTYEEGGKTYDVRVRLAEQDRDRPEAILDVPLRTRSGRLVELRNIARIDDATGPVQIDRQDRSRQITLLANLDSDKKLSSAMADVSRIEGEIGLPEGVKSKFTGEAEMMEESFANINFSLFLAVVLIYMVLAAQFESLVHPFTVMLSLPLSIVGALGLLVVTGRTLSIFSMIGMIMLMGLVTKNAILLVDYTNVLRSRGVDRDEAVRRAGPVRLRPILMTALSTIAGMIPVAIGLGSGAEQRAPMGTAIVGGMVTSTFLTLLVVPVVYTLMDDFGAFTRRLLFGASAELPPPEPQSKPSDQGTWIATESETVRLRRDEKSGSTPVKPAREMAAPRESA